MTDSKQLSSWPSLIEIPLAATSDIFSSVTRKLNMLIIIEVDYETVTFIATFKYLLPLLKDSVMSL